MICCEAVVIPKSIEIVRTKTQTKTKTIPAAITIYHDLNKSSVNVNMLAQAEVPYLDAQARC
jgi:hypothetical protein